MMLWGGITAAALEWAFGAAGLQGEPDKYGNGIGPVLLAAILGAFVIGVAGSLISRQQPTKTRA